MTDPFTLTAIDTMEIQHYIFGTNNLQHIIGASGLVHWATHDAVIQSLKSIGDTNASAVGDKDSDVNATIENEMGLSSEVIYAGGGNAAILFRTIDIARKFAKEFTSSLLLKVPGLQVVVTHIPLTWDMDVLSDKVNEIKIKLNEKKQDRPYSTPILRLGVTADCEYTGLPATCLEKGEDTRDRYVSSEVHAKAGFFQEANQRLKRIVPLKNKLDYIYDFDQFGTPEEASYIAVIHADGNGIGNRVKAIARQFIKSEENRNYIENIRAFSASIEKAAIVALNETVYQLIECQDSDAKIGGVVDIHNQQLPFRPIIFGGDDVTFVCDGRLGLSVAEYYLERLKEQNLYDNRPFFARAGIAVVKTHYPISRAVTLSDSLADSARKYIKKRQSNPENEQDQELSALDWHFASSGPLGDLDTIRKTEYLMQERNLVMRPIRIGESVGPDWHSWGAFTTIIDAFQGDKWKSRRNKLIGLRKVLRDGPDAVKQFRTLHILPPLPKVIENDDSTDTGWAADGCTCFDAIEALDFYVPLSRSDRR